MPRVLRIINRLNLGGPTYNAALLTKYMSPDFETLLVAGTKTESEASSEFIVKELGVDYVQLPEMSREINLNNDRIAYKKIKQIILDFKPDIVHTHSAKAGTLGRLAASSLKVPVIVHTFHGHVFHSYFSPLKTRIFLGIERYLAKKSSAIIALSEIQKVELASAYKIAPSNKITIIPLGFDLTRFNTGTEEKRKSFRLQYGLNEEELAIGIIGRLVPVKNHALFLRSLKQVLDSTDKKIKAFIIGDGEECDRLKKLAEFLNIPYAINSGNSKVPLVFTSWIKNIDRAMAGLDIVAMTSLNEGTPVSLIEAQAAGKAIVTTNVGGIENIVKPHLTALLSQSGDVNAFSKNMLEVIENEHLRKEMCRNGWKNIEQRFNYTRLVADMKRLYYELLDKQSI